MNYHDTVPTAGGLYLIDRNEALFLRDGQWTGNGGTSVDDVERFLPLLGPLPETDDAMLALACEVAFARMWLAYHNATIETKMGQVGDNWFAIVCSFERNERSLSLLRDMERVTTSLTAPPAQ